MSILNLPTDRERASNRTVRVAREQTSLDEKRLRQIRASRAEDIGSVPAAVFAAFQVLLHRLTAQDQFTIAVRHGAAPGASFAAPARGDGGAYPVDCAVSGAAPFRALVASAAAALRYPSIATASSLGPGPRELDLPLAFAAGDVSLSTAPAPGQLAVALEYDPDLFDPVTIRRWLESYERLLLAAIADPDREIAMLPWVSESDLALMRTCNETTADESNACVHDLFAARVLAAPDAVAVEFEGATITYAELHRQARQLAARLRQRGVGAGSLVGLSIERSIDMIVGVMGILEAGAAYVPLDPGYPGERLAFMIEDSRMQVVVTHSTLVDVLPVPRDLEAVFIDLRDPAADGAAPERPVATPDSIAYVIFTSGSTGRPKGVLVPHRSVVNLLDSVRRRPGMTSDDVVLAITTLSFDIAVSEVLLPLTVGARIVLAGKETASDGPLLRRLIDDRGVTFIDATPSTWRLLIDAGWRGRDGVTSICTGEAMPRDLARDLAAMPGRLWNGYGPTETTVWSTFHEVTPPVDRVLIGTPVANTRLYVLDERMQVVPVGIPGELYIAGAGVTRGYLNRPDLTRERFVPEVGRPDERMYRTGDIARFLNDGTVECLGRIDDQVKIRGFRIELGEIEEVLAAHDGVARAAVVAREDRPGDKRLVAYIVGRPDFDLTVGELRGRVRSFLPDFMVPSAFVFLDALPLTPSGKVNRRALPAPTFEGSETRRVAEPRTPTEGILAALWKQALGIETVSMDDDFFLLGGHSLTASHVLARLRRDHHVDLPFRILFEAPTITQLAQRIDTRPRTAERISAAIEPGVSRAPSRLSLTQERMWLLETMDPHQQIVHNLPFAWRLEGPLDVDALERSLAAIVRRHETLRTRIIVRDGQPLQDVVFDAAIALAKIDLTGLPEERREAAAWAFCERESRTAQNLSAAPLLRAALIRTAEDQHILLIVPHNLIWDGWSFEIFLRELTSFYAREATGRAAALPALPIAYRDFARWQREWLEGPEAAQQRTWWAATLAGHLPVLQLPGDRPRPDDQTREALHVASTWSRSRVDALAAIGRGSGATLFTVLFAALSVVLHRVSGQPDILVGVPVRARTRPETEELVGPFLNMLVLRSRIDRDTRFADLLAQARNQTLDAFSHQELPLEAVDARAPILRAFFTFEDGRQRSERMGDLRMSPVPVLPPAVAADVRLSATETRDGLSVVWTCSAELFDRSTADRLLKRLEAVIDAIVRDPGARVADIDMLSGEERRQLQAFNESEPPADVDVCVHTLIERHAARTPTDAAVVFGDEVIEYGSLDRQANSVARALSARGVVRGSTVAVYLARSAEYLVSLLGIMKAGAVCVPLDPADPPARVTAILEHSGAAIVITDWARRRQLPQQPLPIVCIDEAVVPTSACGHVESVVPDSLDATACLLYACEARELRATPLSHGTLASLLGSIRRELALTNEDVALAIAPPSLDVSVVELLAPLSAAACVMIADDDVALDSDRLTEAVGRSATTMMIAPTPVWADLLGEASVTWPRLRAVCYGAIPARSVAAELGARTASAWFAHGVTPAGIWTTLNRLNERDTREVIGKPLANAALRIVDGDGRDLPIGVVGQLLLRLKDAPRPEAAADQSSDAGPDWIRIGYQARWRGDGAVELLSKRPRETYIDGFRINLDDVASVIRRHPTVEDAEVVLDEAMTPARLMACIVPREGATYSVSELRRELRRNVPAAMVPRSFVEVGSIPRLPDGSAPFELFGVARTGAAGYVPPETPTEQMLADLWADAIGIPKVSVHDNFFALGGYSLLCFQVLDRLERKTGLRVSPRHLLLDTLRQVAAHVDTLEGASGQLDAASGRSGAGMLQRLRRLVPGSA